VCDLARSFAVRRFERRWTGGARYPQGLKVAAVHRTATAIEVNRLYLARASPAALLVAAAPFQNLNFLSQFGHTAFG
jgi:hypothetical protein